jgi:hypothetical protein
METFQVSTTLDNAFTSPELPNTVVTGHPYLDHIAAFSLFNKTGSGKKVRIKEILVSPISSVGVTTLGVLELRTISALVGGNAVTPTKLDSNNASLPSQVSIVSRPSSITTSNQALQRILAAPAQNILRAGQMLSTNNTMADKLPSSRHLWRDTVTSQVQKITLREGQGLSFNPTSWNYNAQYEVCFWVRVVATGACYLAQKVVGINELSPLAILNGSGSGVVLEIFNVQFLEVGEDTIPLITYEMIDGVDTQQVYETLTPVAFDSSNSLSSSIIIQKNASVNTEGKNAGALIAVAQKSRIVGQTSLIGAGIGINLANAYKRGNALFKANQSELEIVLREGKGLGVFIRNGGLISNYEIAVTFLEEDSGGATCNYPVEGDVESGVGYGAGGTEYTGTFVVPTEAQVEDGVGFGEDGTEFLGELTGGTGLLYIDLE